MRKTGFLQRIERAAAVPLSVLGFVWLILAIVGLVNGYTPWLQTATYGIWAVFLLDFAIRLTIAPRKLDFLKRNALLAVSLLLPALGMFQVLRVFSVFPVWQTTILRIVASAHRSIRILGATMHRRGLVYALLLTSIVTFVGAAGMYRFEHAVPGGSPIHSYGDAVWWTAMVMTTLGSDYFPHTEGGRVLCFLLSVFAFSVFGYVTAAISSYFINRDADDKDSAVPSAEQLKEIMAELRALREQLAMTHPNVAESKLRTRYGETQPRAPVASPP